MLRYVAQSREFSWLIFLQDRNICRELSAAILRQMILNPDRQEFIEALFSRTLVPYMVKMIRSESVPIKEILFLFDKVPIFS